MRVIRATPAQLPALAGLFHAYRAFYGRPREDARVEAFLRERLARDDSVILLAVDDEREGAEDHASGEVLGFAQLYPTFSSIRLRRAWILNDLFTAPAHRRRGVARALLAAVKAVARESGAALVELATAESNASARALYESAGYRLDDFLHYYLELPAEPDPRASGR
ncbi:MAG TPA: GNAT family N-acetyltransferase [Longimicrobiales bacterium]|nr:GNAT family N-acetyltransferase [Longimicrobiales bacterium]